MECLVFLKDNYDPDPDMDRAAFYKKGMVISVRDDGDIWGRMESVSVWISEGNQLSDWPHLGEWGILKIPQLPAQRLQHLVKPQKNKDDGAPWHMPFYRRRENMIQLDNIPTVYNELLTKGEFTGTPGDLKNNMVRIFDKSLLDFII